MPALDFKTYMQKYLAFVAKDKAKDPNAPDPTYATILNAGKQRAFDPGTVSGRPDFFIASKVDGVTKVGNENLKGATSFIAREDELIDGLTKAGDNTKLIKAANNTIKTELGVAARDLSKDPTWEKFWIEDYKPAKGEDVEETKRLILKNYEFRLVSILTDNHLDKLKTKQQALTEQIQNIEAGNPNIDESRQRRNKQKNEITNVQNEMEAIAKKMEPHETTKVLGRPIISPFNKEYRDLKKRHDALVERQAGMLKVLESLNKAYETLYDKHLKSLDTNKKEVDAEISKASRKFVALKQELRADEKMRKDAAATPTVTPTATPASTPPSTPPITPRSISATAQSVSNNESTTESSMKKEAEVDTDEPPPPPPPPDEDVFSAEEIAAMNARAESRIAVTKQTTTPEPTATPLSTAPNQTATTPQPFAKPVDSSLVARATAASSELGHKQDTAASMPGPTGEAITHAANTKAAAAQTSTKTKKIKPLPLAIQKFYADPTYAKELLDFANREQASENIEFLKAVGELEKIADNPKKGENSKEFQAKAKEIRDTYVDPKSGTQANLSETDRDAIMALGKSDKPYTKEAFRNPKAEIASLVNRDTVPRFEQFKEEEEENKNAAASKHKK